MKKPVKEWLKELPQHIAERALAQMKHPDFEAPSLEAAILAFVQWWGDTKEGKDFWHQVYCSAESDENYPSIASLKTDYDQNITHPKEDRDLLISHAALVKKALSLWPDPTPIKWSFHHNNEEVAEVENCFGYGETRLQALYHLAVLMRQPEDHSKWDPVISFLSEFVQKS